MDFVNEENGIRVALQRLQYTLEALFEIAAILGASKEGTHVERVDNGIRQDVRHLFVYHASGQAFGNGRFANACFANQQRVVFAPTAKNLYHAFQLTFATDQWINLAFLGKRIQIHRELFQRPSLAFLSGVGLTVFTLRLGAVARHFGDAVGNKIHQIQARDILFLQVINSVRIFLAKNGHQHIGPGDFFFAGRLHVQNCALNDALEPQRWLCFRLDIFGNAWCVLLREARQLMP